jgi:hypothetical protein
MNKYEEKRLAIAKGYVKEAKRMLKLADRIVGRIQERRAKEDSSET